MVGGFDRNEHFDAPGDTDPIVLTHRVTCRIGNTKGNNNRLYVGEQQGRVTAMGQNSQVGASGQVVVKGT